MFYDRKIKYFDFRKNGERLQGAGYTKLEVRNGTCKLEIHISGLNLFGEGRKMIYLLGEGREELLCPIVLNGGRGEVGLTFAADNLCSGISYESLMGFRIPVGAGAELYCEVCKEEPHSQKEMAEVAVERNVKEDCEKKLSEENTPGGIVEEVTEKAAVGGIIEELTEKVAVGGIVEEEYTGEVVEKSVAERDVEEDYLEEEYVEELTERSIVGRGTEEKPADSNHRKGVEMSLPMQQSKWEQLSAIYPHIAPFQDQRDYLRLGPEDFVILNQKYYGLAHNSFLLHGYYNYRHLVLVRQGKRGDMRYYVGVPGNFYEREKQVALMFGFEYFECRNEPAGQGEYGYYMIRVEL